MYSYIARRLLLMMPTLLGVITLTFFIYEFVPGGPVEQIEAMLKGRNAGGAETAAADPSGKRRGLDPQTGIRLMRVYGLNHSRLERYLRTLLWYGRDSVISGEEIDEGSAEKFTTRGRAAIIVRRDNRYSAFLNNWPVNGRDGEVVYDREKACLRSVLDNRCFAAADGRCLDGSPGGLTVLPVELRRETSATLRAEKGRLVKIEAVRDELYLREKPGRALCNFDNWHGLLLFKFGNSITYNRTVTELIWERLPVSVSLGVYSFFIIYATCLLLGIAKAVRNGTPFDAVTSAAVLIGYSVPGFVLAVFVLVYLGPGEASLANWVPLAGLTSAGSAPDYAAWSLGRRVLDYFHHIAAPVFCLSIGGFAVLTMLTKNSVLEELHQLYAVAARARGLSRRAVLFKHVFRNSLIPLVTGFPASFLFMFFSGSILIEQIFSLNGIGLLGYTAILNRDFPVIIGDLYIFTLLGLAGQLLTDISYVIVDPRISFEANKA